jgi:hypothetical protein
MKSRIKKKILLPAGIGLAVFIGLMALQRFQALAAGTTPATITLTWNAPTSGVPDIYKVYETTNLGEPLTNWAVVSIVPGSLTQASVSVYPGAYCFVCTASNFWGESPFSNQAGVPAPAQPGSNLRIRLGP